MTDKFFCKLLNSKRSTPVCSMAWCKVTCNMIKCQPLLFLPCVWIISFHLSIVALICQKHAVNASEKVFIVEYFFHSYSKCSSGFPNILHFQRNWIFLSFTPNLTLPDLYACVLPKESTFHNPTHKTYRKMPHMYCTTYRKMFMTFTWTWNVPSAWLPSLWTCPINII